MQCIGILIRSLGGSDVEICSRDLLAGLPEAHLLKSAKVPGKRPRIRGDHRDARAVYAFPTSRIFDFTGESEDVVRGVGIGIGITFLNWSEKDALARVMGNQHTQQNCGDAEEKNGSAPAKPCFGPERD